MDSFWAVESRKQRIFPAKESIREQLKWLEVERSNGIHQYNILDHLETYNLLNRCLEVVQFHQHIVHILSSTDSSNFAACSDSKYTNIQYNYYTWTLYRRMMYTAVYKCQVCLLHLIFVYQRQNGRRAVVQGTRSESKAWTETPDAFSSEYCERF